MQGVHLGVENNCMGEQHYHLVPLGTGYLGSDWGVAQWASWAVHGVVHGVVHRVVHGVVMLFDI